MQQQSLELGQSTKRTRRGEFLGEMQCVVPWGDLVALVSPSMPEGRRGRSPFPVEGMLRIHFMQQQFNLSDPAVEDALHDVPLFRDFAVLSGWDDLLPDEMTTLRFRHVLEQKKLAPQNLKTVNELLQLKGLLLKTSTVVGATLIAAPCSTKYATGESDPEVVSSASVRLRAAKKGNQWYFGMKDHIGTDAESGLVHTVRRTAGNLNDVVEANSLLQWQETEAWGDTSYQGAAKRPDARPDVRWNIAVRPGKCKQHDPDRPIQRLTDDLERIKASIRAKVEHPLRVINRQFGHLKVRYRGLAKNTAHLRTLFVLANLWMARKPLAGAQA